MSEDERPVIESEGERSTRHSRMVFAAAIFVVVLSLTMFAFAAVWLWFRDGSVDFEALAVPFLIVVMGVGIGMIFELRRRW